MIVDLHSHYPMHLVARDNGDLPPVDPSAPTDALQAFILHLANKIANYQAKGDSAAVTIDSLTASKVGVALSMLYAPFDEMDFSLSYGSAPRPIYFEHLKEQLALVESSLKGHESAIVVAHNPAELAAAGNRVALIHAVEGGFHLGSDPATIKQNVAELAQLGVAYITPAHLFWRQVATNAPALPFMSDDVYHFVFCEPEEGLTDLGKALVGAMAANGIFIDLTHMSEASIADTFTVLDALPAAQRDYVMATHSCCRLGKHEYSISDDNIRRVAQHDGVIGLIVCSHLMCDGLPGPVPSNFDESVAVMGAHIDHIASVTGSYDHIAIGSDQDGFIKPALHGLETPSGISNLEAAFTNRYKSGDIAAKICSGNAMRLLSKWRGRIP